MLALVALCGTPLAIAVHNASASAIAAKLAAKGSGQHAAASGIQHHHAASSHTHHKPAAVGWAAAASLAPPPKPTPNSAGGEGAANGDARPALLTIVSVTLAPLCASVSIKKLCREGTGGARSSWLFTCLLITAFLGLNSGLSILNRWALGVHGLRFPLIMTSMHMVSTSKKRMLHARAQALLPLYHGRGVLSPSMPPSHCTDIPASRM